MKRTVSLLLSLVLVLFASCALGETFETSYFTMTLPDGWVAEYDNLEPIENGEELGYFSGPGDLDLICSAALVRYDETDRTSLWQQDEQGLQEYAQMLVESLEDSSVEAEYLTTVYAGQIPFVVLICKSSDEDFYDSLFADTVTNGVDIIFEACLSDGSDEDFEMTEEKAQEFLDILSTFTPVTGS